MFKNVAQKRSFLQRFFIQFGIELEILEIWIQANFHHLTVNFTHPVDFP